MVNVIGTASELGYINIPENTLIDIEHLKNYKKEDTVLITTGSRASLWRHCPVWRQTCTRRFRLCRATWLF